MLLDGGRRTRLADSLGADFATTSAPKRTLERALTQERASAKQGEARARHETRAEWRILSCLGGVAASLRRVLTPSPKDDAVVLITRMKVHAMTRVLTRLAR